MPHIIALIFTSIVTLSAAFPQWPFSWETLPTFAFPGAASRFMTDTEVLNFTQSWSNILIWGLNASCYLPSGAIVPATCPAAQSHCWCNETAPETQRWVTNMETSLQAQGAALKAVRPDFPVLGYIEYLSAQQYYAAQSAIWTNASLASMMLSVESKGLIDCFTDGCNWQGTEFRQYDLRRPEARAYYVDVVIGTLINSQYLDGTFLDSIDWWTTSACNTWPCTSAEVAALTAGALQTLDMTLASAASLGKVLSVSSHTSLNNELEFYLAQTALLVKNGNGIRFWEFWEANEDYIESLIYETKTLGLPTHVHTAHRTLNPDWVELATFLLGAGQFSYFSYSGPWNLDSFNVYPEYTMKLGAPLGDAVNETVIVPTAPWQLLYKQNLVFDLPPAPNSSIPGLLAFVGVFAEPTSCAKASQGVEGATAFTWAGASDGVWANHCWARLDVETPEFWQSCISNQDNTSPCYATIEDACVSGVAVPLSYQEVVWKRSFEHLDVVYWSSNSSATLTPT